MGKRSGHGRQAEKDSFNKQKHNAKYANKGSAIKKGHSSDNPYRTDPKGGKGGGFYRTRATINRLKMYNAKPDK